MKQANFHAPPLFDHQIKSIRFMIDNNRVLDTSDPGTGKTRVQVELTSLRLRAGGGKTLVLAPKSLLYSAWDEDFKKFAPHIRTSVATATNREKAFQCDADVYITNVDAAKWLSKQPKKFFDQFDTLIIDEISAYKHHTSQRSKAILKISKYFDNRFGLTGTPATNSVTDIWHQAKIIDGGERLGTSFFHFRTSVCEPKQVGPSENHIKWIDKPGAEVVVTQLLSDISVRHKFEDCIDIPENHMYSVPYTLTPKQRRAYEEFERDAVIMMDTGEIVSSVNAAGVMGKLMQISSGASYAESLNDDSEYAVIDSGRYELVAELADERPHSVIFFMWRHQRELIAKELEKRKITYKIIDGTTTDKERRDAVKGFQMGLYRVILAHPTSAAHGLTLTKGTATIWPNPTYNLEHFLQGNARIYRASQTERTETIIVTARDTVEEKVYERLQEKDARQSNMLDILKDSFNERS